MMLKYFTSGLLLLLFVTLLQQCRVAYCDVIVHTVHGDVRGVNTGRSLAFLGVPFAAPPIGNLRWEPPQDPKSWAPSIHNATTVPPGCPQKTCGDPPHWTCPMKVSEDCLNLNIWTPLTAKPGTKFPAMLYFHGGSFTSITGGAPIFNGDYFAMKGQVILVNIEYRLGLLGFLYTGDAPTDARGNYGLLDQRHAMKWVQTNIGYFGGDPTRVTIFGESSGAQSVGIHLMSDRSAGLFTNAIMESNPLDIPFKFPSEVIHIGVDAVKRLQCPVTDLKCLRSKPVDEILKTQNAVASKFASFKLFEYFIPLGPYIDGEDVPSEPMVASMNDNIQKKPIIIGSNSQECVMFIYAWNHTISEAEYIAFVLAAWSIDTVKVLERYPPPKVPDLRGAAAQFSTDFIFTCTGRNFSRNLIKFNSPDIYRYEFDHAFKTPGMWGKKWYCEQHVCHGEEIAFVFGTDYNATTEERALSDQMIAYWTNFAHSSNPNVGPNTVAVNWPRYKYMEPGIMHFKTPENELLSDYRDEYCDFWDTIGYKV